MDQINVLGIPYRFQIAQNSKTNQEENQENCFNIKRGVCKVCICNECRSGHINTKKEDGTIHTEHCRCTKKAFSKYQIVNNGLSEQMDKCTLDTYIVKEPWHQTVKDKALSYLEKWKTNSFVITGNSGGGKTHICVAILNALVDREDIDFRYMRWITDSAKLKSLKTTDFNEYERLLDSFKNTEVLYIDDFFKGEVTDADIKLACDIIFHRYERNKPMIISSEKSLQDIGQLRECEAVAGRIFELTGKGEYNINIVGSNKNQRFKI